MLCALWSHISQKCCLYMPALHSDQCTCGMQENIKLTALENKSGHPSFPNLNTREYLDKIKETVLENLRHLSHAPGVLPA